MHHDRETEVNHEQSEVDEDISAEEALKRAVSYCKHHLSDADVEISMENLSCEVHKGLTGAARAYFGVPEKTEQARHLEREIGRLVLFQILEDQVVEHGG